jgi:caa(3)-type oxidase subunit IV
VTVTDLLKRPTTVVWLTLMLATVITTWFLAKDAFPAPAGTVGIILIAAIKARLVLNYFMELGTAPRAARIVFEGWVAVVTIGVIGLYLAA